MGLFCKLSGLNDISVNLVTIRTNKGDWRRTHTAVRLKIGTLPMTDLALGKSNRKVLPMNLRIADLLARSGLVTCQEVLA